MLERIVGCVISGAAYTRVSKLSKELRRREKKRSHCRDKFPLSTEPCNLRCKRTLLVCLPLLLKEHQKKKFNYKTIFDYKKPPELEMQEKSE